MSTQWGAAKCRRIKKCFRLQAFPIGDESFELLMPSAYKAKDSSADGATSNGSSALDTARPVLAVDLYYRQSPFLRTALCRSVVNAS